MIAGLRFALVGRGPLLAACSDALRARGHAVTHGVSACDYLLSIVNHDVLDAAALGCATMGAINYHDSLLPQYAGFNATSWAILNGETRHGISWHEMTPEADRGPILLQRAFGVADDDTAFTLSVKCTAAAVESFEVLLDQIEAGTIAPRAQAGTARLYRRSELVRHPVLDVARPARDLSALVRALDFGPHDDSASGPRLLHGGRTLVVRDARAVASSVAGANVASGTVVSVDDAAIVIETTDGSLAMSGFATADGATISVTEAIAFLGIRAGDRLGTSPAAPIAQRQTTVHEQVAHQAARTPGKIALVFGDEQLTYRELDTRANAIAHTLRAAGVGPDVLAGVCIERSLDLVVAMLGVLKAGGAYVPLDPAYPAERVRIMLEDSGVRVVVTQRSLAARVAAHGARTVLVDDTRTAGVDEPPSSERAMPGDLAYVMFTSGSTGRPKGIMVEHRNVTSFFAAMDAAIGNDTQGVWLAATSVSFDISVLELLWTLARGFEVVIAPPMDRATLTRVPPPQRARDAMRFGLFYFAADAGTANGTPYKLLLDGARFADANGFEAVWTPERHFHAFGGLYPNPAVTTAALATITSNVQLRAGSVVLPLHDPVRVAEDWAVVDQLSGGRVGLSFASGWHANDFVLEPDNYARRREIMCEHIETVLALWRGETISRRNGAGESVDVSALPRPVQARPPIWLASAGSVETFELAGRMGANVLTNMLGQDLDDLSKKFAAYRAARRAHGHEGDGVISVMLHTFVCDDDAVAKRTVRKPFTDYLASSFALVKAAPKMFPAFRQPSRSGADNIDTSAFTPEDMTALLDHAFERYYETAGLFGTPERAYAMVEQLARIGATEIACLIDFGVDADVVLASLPHLARLQELCAERAGAEESESLAQHASIADLIRRHSVTHFQCTPSVARVLAADADALGALASLDTLLVGGERLPASLGETLARTVRGRVFNMYGPTETTVWSTVARVSVSGAHGIGHPIAGTTVHVLDETSEPVASGEPGELWIGGAGVARGYLNRPDLTAERFVDDPRAAGARLYRTGDRARVRTDGALEYMGRVDEQLKIGGHRIEPAEIEAVLAQHPAVRECAVVATDDDAPSLTAYIVPVSARERDRGVRVEGWARIWDAAYARGSDAHDADPRFDTTGWTDSATGDALPAHDMREWLDATVERILALESHDVLEIGCGTGMVLHRVLPHVTSYTGTDVSDVALAHIRDTLTDADGAKVTLVHAPAHDIARFTPRSFDLVVINSVAQYFPDARYFADVLGGAAELVRDGGHVFVGDVRSFAHLRDVHRAVESRRAPADAAALESRVARAVALEPELTVSEHFFAAVARQHSRLSSVGVQLKRGTAHNDVTRFRYDVVLGVGPRASDVVDDVAHSSAHDIGAIRADLVSRPRAIALTDVPNARLTAGESGVDPEALFTIDPAYDVRIRWARSGDPARFDALLQRKESGIRDWPLPRVAGEPTTFASAPASFDDGSLTAELRTFAARELPDALVPANIVVTEALPMTPNSKVDRSALRARGGNRPTVAASYTAPASELEVRIAGVWRELLHTERVSRGANIFDLGANSLLTMQANNRISALLGRRVPLVSMFRFPTVAALAAHLGDAPAANDMLETRAAERPTSRARASERRRARRLAEQDR